MNTTSTVLPESLVQAHQALIADLRRVQELLRPENAVRLDELRDHLSVTYTHLCEHFRLEDRSGFFEELEASEPRFERVAEEMRAEHRELRRTLDSLHWEAIEASCMAEPLRARIRAWVNRVLRHETRENDLLQDAADSDFGGQD
jgi:hypothetical protein